MKIQINMSDRSDELGLLSNSEDVLQLVLAEKFGFLLFLLIATTEHKIVSSFELIYLEGTGLLKKYEKGEIEVILPKCLGCIFRRSTSDSSRL